MTSRTRPPTKSMTIASGDCEKEVRISWRPKTEVVEVVPGVFCAGSVSSNVVGAADAYSSVAEGTNVDLTLSIANHQLTKKRFIRFVAQGDGGDGGEGEFFEKVAFSGKIYSVVAQ